MHTTLVNQSVVKCTHAWATLRGATHRIGLACDARRSDRRLPIVPSPTPTNPIERCEQRMRSLMRQCERECECAAALRASVGFRRTRAACFA